MKKLFLLFVSILATCQLLFSQIPPTYDLRDVNGINYVTSVKAQQGGTCWTFGAMAAMEGNMLLSGAWTQAGEQGEPNLAEYHLDWWNGFNTENNDDLNPPTGNGLSVHNGGDYRVTAAYLSRGEGAVRDIDAQSFSTPPTRRDSSYHYFYPRTIEWFTAGPDLERINTIKKKVMDYGALGTCMCVGFWSPGNIHYQPIANLSDPNHAVTIIGWNDTLSTPADEPGAWLVKNSWGSNWGNYGYFWISYYDKHCGQEPQMGAISFQEVEVMQYEKVYYHDYHGWRDELTFTNEAFNSFVTTDFQELESISFFNAADSIQFQIIIFDSFTNNMLSDTLDQISGFINHIGLHTINLDSSIYLSPNQDFYVYLFLSKGGHPFDRTSEVPVLLGANTRTTVSSTSSPGQSFYFRNNIWNDLYNHDSTANFCIKALANPLLPSSAAKPMGDTSLCLGTLSTTYQIPATPFSDSYNWHLLPDSAGILSVQDTMVTIDWAPNFSGQVSLTVVAENNNGFGDTSAALNIFLHQLPQFTIGGDTAIYENETITFSTNKPFANYLWVDGSASSSTQFDGAVLGQGNHVIWLEVTDSNSCNSRDSLVLTILPPNSIDDYQKEDFWISPNPSNGDIKISMYSQNKKEASLVVINHQGQVVFEREISLSTGENLFDIHLHDLSAGVYLVKMATDQVIYNKKVILY